MADKFQNTYRIPSAPANWWDYSADGIYFITICTSGHVCFFGQIINKQMLLSDIGLLAQKEWDKSFAIRKELRSEAFVIMPNHIHAIIRIDSPVETHGGASHGPNGLAEIGDAPPCVSTARYGIAYRPPRSIASFVAGFKQVVTIKALKVNPGFGWQDRFYDSIVRNDEEYQRIADYVENNPVNWGRINFSELRCEIR